MNFGVIATLGLAILTAGSAFSADCQVPGKGQTAPQARLSTTTSAPAEGMAAGNVIREIDDPHTGDRWLLTRDPGRPGGPGRMVLASSLGEPDREGPRGAPLTARRQISRPLPVIHTGDRLIVEQDSALIKARLEAVALGPAMFGAQFNVRLIPGGQAVQAVALGPGRAAFAPDPGVRP